ncbi:MAG: Mut7-C RNAse domain-containing protein [Verrucomicrobiota bacterium]
MNTNEVRFAADGMLQSLAKWLRLLGYDCAAGNDLFGRKLLELAVMERRWVLTRNRRLSGEMPLALLSLSNIYLVASDRLPDQLREVVDRFALEKSAGAFSRCIICNEPLGKLASADAAQGAPPEVFKREKQFWRCSHCNRVFWRGSHVDNSLQRLHQWLP